MKAIRMLRWMPLIGLVVGVTLLPGRPRADELPASSLRALEHRALLAQALTSQVDALRKQLKDIEDDIQERDREIESLRETIEESKATEARLREKLADHERLQSRYERLIALFRSGSFEYYQVRDGDDLESIATNPMVYGDPARAAWIAHANGLSEQDPLTPGMVLIIPRFSEGVSYEF